MHGWGSGAFCVPKSAMLEAGSHLQCRTADPEELAPNRDSNHMFAKPYLLQTPRPELNRIMLSIDACFFAAHSINKVLVTPYPDLNP